MGARRRSRIRHTRAVALRLAGLRMRSRRMKHKLRILGRRQLALTQEIASLEARRRPALPLAPPGRARGDARKDPIWIHAPWRAGSTYVWNKFRSCPKHLAFYEPFHETLETLTHADAEATTETSWPSGHPPLDAPYYREFEPLLMPGGGVRGFEQAFPYTYLFRKRRAARAPAGLPERSGRPRAGPRAPAGIRLLPIGRTRGLV